MEKKEFLTQFDKVSKDGNYGHRKREDVQELIRQHMLALGQPDMPIGFQELFISIEELADVNLVLSYIETVLDVDHNDVEIATEVKIRKLEKLLAKAREQGLGMHDRPEREML